MSKCELKTLHNVYTERSGYSNTRIIQYNGRLFKFHNEIRNGSNRFTIELFDGDKWNYIACKEELGLEVETGQYSASYVSDLSLKKSSTEYAVKVGIEFIKLLLNN